MLGITLAAGSAVLMFELFLRTVKVALANTSVKFRSARDFEFALAGRVGMPASKVGALVALADDDWCAIIRALNQVPAQHEEFKRVTLVTSTCST
jgi:hypothetical protein